MKRSVEVRELELKTLQQAISSHLFREPLEYIFADHFRQRTLCKMLDDIAHKSAPDPELARAACDFMKNEFWPHVQDEELDLFPMLRQRSIPADEIDGVLDQLCEEHSADQADASDIIPILERLSQKNTPSLTADEVQLLSRFADNERQHLILENAIVLPLARVRLTQADQVALGERMAARRRVKLEEVSAND